MENKGKGKVEANDQIKSEGGHANATFRKMYGIKRAEEDDV